MEELILELKEQIIKALNLEEMTPEDIETDAPLFGEGRNVSISHRWSRDRRTCSSALLCLLLMHLA